MPLCENSGLCRFVKIVSSKSFFSPFSKFVALEKRHPTVLHGFYTIFVFINTGTIGIVYAVEL